MKLNKAIRISRPTTYESAPVDRITAEQQLRRSVLSCMLWESSFYEDGQEIADRIENFSMQVSQHTLATIAVEARTMQHIRHAPLLLTAVLAGVGQGTSLVSDTLEQVILRADEPAEFLSIYAKVNGVTPDKIKPKLSAQVRKGLARAMRKFDAYQLGKYNRDGAVKLRDVLFLCHPRPRDAQQEANWNALISGTLEAPDTWEVALSGGADKRETFERLIREHKLGYLALLRNLRNAFDAGVDRGLLGAALVARQGGADKVLPFRYVAAARACPALEPWIDQALMAAIREQAAFSGKTVILVDVSGSMEAKLSAKSDMTRMDAAAALASIVNADELRVFTFSDRHVEVAPRRGMAGVDAVIRSQYHGGTYLGKAVKTVNDNVKHDRLIVITDEQSHDPVPAPVVNRAYMINVACDKNGVGYRNGWTHIDGWSESVIRYITTAEASDV